MTSSMILHHLHPVLNILFLASWTGRMPSLLVSLTRPSALVLQIPSLDSTSCSVNVSASRVSPLRLPETILWLPSIPLSVKQGTNLNHLSSHVFVVLCLGLEPLVLSYSRENSFIITVCVYIIVDIVVCIAVWLNKLYYVYLYFLLIITCNPSLDYPDSHQIMLNFVKLFTNKLIV